MLGARHQGLDVVEEALNALSAEGTTTLAIWTGSQTLKITS